jgi:DNA polymerase-3 subunit delta
MKYQNLSSFEKHLQGAAKLPLSRIYLVISSCPYERRKIVEKISAVIGLDVRIKEGDLEDQIAELNTASLFEGKQLLYLDGIDKLKKNGLSLLADYAARPSPFAYLLLGAGSSKQLDDLYAKGKKEMIVCDLSNEKPWDRKDRLKRMLVDEAAKAGKRLSGDAVEYLLENIGLSLPGLEQELVKLITYAGERRELTFQDVQALCGTQKSMTPWQLAEAIVWKENVPQMGKIDLALLMPLLSQTRLQLQHGLVLATLAERGAAHEEIVHHLPAVKPAALDKMLPIVKRRRSVYFKRALDALFEIELMAKNSSFEPDLILDLLMAKFTLYSRL